MSKDNLLDKLQPDIAGAINTLLTAGFAAVTHARVSDGRDITTRRRIPRLHRRSRCALALAVETLDPIMATGEELETEAETAQPEVDPPDTENPEDVPVDESRTDAVKPAELPPIDKMTVEQLRAEAKNYPDIVGEYKMNKAELQAAVRAQRDRRALLFKKFTLDPDPGTEVDQ